MSTIRVKPFDNGSNYIGYHPRRCNLKERNGKRSMVVSDVKTVGEGVMVLRDIEHPQS